LDMLHKLRFVIYPIVFSVMFLCASYCTFPKDVLRDMVESSITNIAMGLGPKRGLPNVAVKDVSLWRISGLNLNSLQVIWPAQKTKSPLLVEFDSIKSRIGIFSLLVGAKNISLTTQLYGGSLDADLKISRQNALGFIDMTGSKIDLAKMKFFEATLGAPLQGIINFEVDINGNSELSKDGTGSIKLNWENLGYGPGSIRLPAGGFVSSLTVPKIVLGKLFAEFVLDKGQLESKSFSLQGGDLEADMKMTISLGRQPSSSRVTGDGWFSIKREFVNTNETLKMLFDLIPELREAQSGNGKVGFSVRGNLARPQFKLERYQEKAPKQEPEAKK
jgi:type II secretion system protein N